MTPIVLTNKQLSRFLGMIFQVEGCWNYVGRINDEGYGVFDVGKKYLLAHRISYWYYNQIEPCQMLVCHSCDNRKCNNPKHLFLGTKKSNCLDSIAKGRHSSQLLLGSNRPGSKLTEREVIEIRKKYSTGRYTCQQLGIEYGIDYTTISQITTYKTWRHI